MMSLIARTSAPAAATQNMFVNTTGASTIGHVRSSIRHQITRYQTNSKHCQKLTFIQLVSAISKVLSLWNVNMNLIDSIEMFG